jgi:predicted MFS family arabinose efflux permease
MVNGLLGRTVIELLPALNGFLLGAGSSELATLTASAGVGSIVGGLVLTRQHADNSRLFHLVSLSVSLAALLLLTLEIATDLWRLAFLILLLSLFTTVAGTACQTITQLSVHEDYRGRVVSLWTLAAMGSPAFGAALIGALAEVWGFISVLVFTGIAGVIVMAWLYTRRRRLASLSV